MDSRDATTRRALIIAAVVSFAFVLRIGWIGFADFYPTISDDAGRYDLLGRSLAMHTAYINPNGTTTMFWPPGYPLVLAVLYKLFGDHGLTAVLALNATLGALSVLLTYAIGRRAFDDRVALGGAVILALFPSMVFFAAVTLTETMFTFLALLVVWLLLESRDGAREWQFVIAAGLVAGFAALVRGQALLLPLVAFPFWWRAADWRPALARAGLMGTLALLVVAPWTWRNYDVSGSLVLISSNAGVDFYIGHSAGADGRGRIVDDLVFRYPDRPQAQAEAQINRDGFREGLKYAAKHPLREIELAARKAFFLYWRDDEALKWNEAHGEHPFLTRASRTALAALSNAYYWAALALAAIGARRWFSVRDPRRLLLISLAAYWTLVHLAFFADPRFHAPIVPVLALWSSCGLAALAASARRLQRRHAAAAVASRV